MSRIIETTLVPTAIEHKLRRIRLRKTSLAVGRAVTLAAFALVAAMMFAMLADLWLTIFDTAVRTTLTLVSIMVAIGTLLATGVRPVIDSLGVKRAAGSADHEVPQLEERWTTVANFAESTHQPQDETTKAMLRQVASEAVALGTLVEPARVVRPDGLRRAGVIFLASSILLAGFLAIDWQQNSVLVKRFWAPMSNISATHLECVSGNMTVPRGESVDIVVNMSGLTRDSAALMLRTETNEKETIELKPDADQPGKLTYHVAVVEQSFRYRVRAGDGQTQWHSVTAIDRPVLAEVRFTVTAPKYIDRPKYEKSYIPNRVRAIEGSRLRVAMRPEPQLDRLELLLTRGDESADDFDVKKLVLKADADGWYRFDAILEENMSLNPMLYTPHGLTNVDQHICSIRVIQDMAPVARVISPTEEMPVNADEIVEIKFEAHDDHGIAMAELIVYDESPTEDGKPPEILSVEEIPLDDQLLKKHILATATLDLSKYDFDEDSNISYAIRVTDNRLRRLDPKPASSKARRAEGSMNAADSEQSEHAPKTTEVAATGPNPKNEPKSETNPSKLGLPTDNEATNKPAKPVDAQTQLAKADTANETGKSNADFQNDPQKEAVESASKKAATKDKSTNDQIPDGDKTISPVTETDKQKVRETQDTELPPAQSNSGASESDEPPQDDKPAAVAALIDGNTPRSDDSANAKNSNKPNEDSPKDSPAKSDKPLESSDANKTDKPLVAESTPAVDEKQNDDSVARREAKTDQSENPNTQSPSEQNQTATAQKSNLGNEPSQVPPPAKIPRLAQLDVMQGQKSESNRLRLKINKRVTVIAQAGNARRMLQMKLRERLVKIDMQLEAAESVLLAIDKQLDETGQSADWTGDFKNVDLHLTQAEEIIGKLRLESKETPFAFAGLQMVDIGRAHITPARDRVFILIRQPDADVRSNESHALTSITRARELLAALMIRYDKIVRDQELAKSLEETAKMYEVYVENMQRLMREARQNRNPLKRKMAVVEVDEAYLARLKEVLKMRSEIMAEFGRILADDPRLLGKYMDLIKRRQSSLRNDLSELRERQEEISEELRGWRHVGKEQREDVWLLASELRLQDASPLASEASKLEERTVAQMPLGLETSQGTAQQIVKHAKQIAVKARSNTNKARRMIQQAYSGNSKFVDLVTDADSLAFHLTEFDAALEQLEFETDDEETTEFILKRLVESRTLAERSIAWARTAAHIQHRRYHGLAEVDQQQIAINTEQLRLAMQDIENQLTGEFPEGDVPPEILKNANELLQVMENITFNQTAATFELSTNRLEGAETQQTMAVDGFERAEKLFDKIRRSVIEELDQIDPDDPNIANLVDPTLDEFLERLEREPDLNALLGIPNRPRNLKVMGDWMLWEEQSADALLGAANDAAQAAMQRAEQQKQAAQKNKPKKSEKDADMTDEQWREVAKAEDLQAKMEEKIKELRQQAAAPETDEEQKAKLLQMAEQLEALRNRLSRRNDDEKQWKELVKSDQMKAVMKALAAGEPLPDNQWNNILSQLDKGLWQVKRRTPPENYRKAIEQYQEKIRRLVKTDNEKDE